MQTSGKHLLSIINDLPDLAKIESGKLELSPQPVSCRELIESVAGALQPLAEAKGLEFNAALPDEDVIVRADRRALSQILINLTNNAIKFTEAGKVDLGVRTHAEEGQDSVTFEVTDTGVGILPEDQARLFAAFEQVGDPSSRPHEGTGLGLYISRKLAELLGGEIAFTSEFGAGTCFSVRIPKG